MGELTYSINQESTLAAGHASNWIQLPTRGISNETMPSTGLRPHQVHSHLYFQLFQNMWFIILHVLFLYRKGYLQNHFISNLQTDSSPN